MKNYQILILSSILAGYYIFLQDFIPVYWFVVVAWSIFNLALVYRVFASSTYKITK